MEFGEDGGNIISSFHPILLSKAADTELAITAQERDLWIAIGSSVERSARC